MAKLNILAISHNYPHRDDPTCGIFAVRQFAEMHKMGVDLTVLVPCIYAPSFISRFERYKLFRPRKLIQYDGVKAITLWYVRPPGKWMLKWDGQVAFWFAKNLVCKMHNYRPFDIIYALGFWHEADIAVRLSKLLGIPAVGVGIGSDVNLTPQRSASFYKHFVQIANKLDCTMATGQGVADKIEAVNGKKTMVMGGLVDLCKFSPPTGKKTVKKELGFPPDDFIILFAGHIIKTKGIYELVTAFRGIKDTFPNVILKICGEGTEMKELQQYINSYNLSSSVKLVGNVKPDDMHRWMQASDLFTLPSYQEGMPNVVMEAMACGLPVVSTSIGGLTAAVGNCEGVVLVPPKSSEQLENALADIIKNNELQKKMAVASRKTAEENFGIKRNTQTVIDQLRKTINEYNKTARHDSSRGG